MSEETKAQGCSEESCATCAHADGCSSKKTDMREPANPYSSVKRVIGVVSGKGGVGKSFVTASLARMMREKGYNVGILDADITGPSIPKMYGIHGQAKGSEEGIFPALAKDGTVWSWGYNYHGQLGNGTKANSSLPVKVKIGDGSVDLTGVVSIAAGYYNSFAVRKDGTVWSWGYNNYG